MVRWYNIRGFTSNGKKIASPPKPQPFVLTACISAGLSIVYLHARWPSLTMHAQAEGQSGTPQRESITVYLVYGQME